MLGFGAIAQFAFGEVPNYEPLVFVVGDVSAFIKRQDENFKKQLDEERVRKERIRADLDLAIHGPPLELKYEPIQGIKTLPPIDVSEITQIMMQMDQQRQIRIKQNAEQEEEEDIENLLSQL